MSAGSFTVAQVRAVMGLASNVRNLSIVGEEDTSSLLQALSKKAGTLTAEKGARADVCGPSGTSLYFEYDYAAEVAAAAADASGAGAGASPAGADVAEEAKKLAEATGAKISETSFLLNLIDCSSTAHLSGQMAAALRVTDGALLVVDCVGGVSVQTETVLGQAIGERVRPVLMLDKLDRCLGELKMAGEDIYKALVKEIEKINVIAATYNDPALGDITLDPLTGRVAFGSSQQQWGFTLNHFAKMYAAKFKTSRSAMMRRLWGDIFYNKEGEWKRGDYASEKGWKRGFTSLVLEPMASLFNPAVTGRKDMLDRVLGSLGVTLSSEEKDLTGSALTQAILQKWMPLGDAVLEMIILQLPSPREAQKYRTEMLYEGPAADACATAMRACDSAGPLMMYISRNVPTSDPGRFYAFGRVFSGKVAGGKSVRIMGPGYKPSQTGFFRAKDIESVVLMLGGKSHTVKDIPAGNTCALVGVDRYLQNTSTVSDSVHAHPIRSVSYRMSPVMRVTVTAKKESDLPKLVEGLKLLARTDSNIIMKKEETGEDILAGANELHLEAALLSLTDHFAKGAPLVISKPMVNYRETIRAKSSKECTAKSANKHNEVTGILVPMPEAILPLLEEPSVAEMGFMSIKDDAVTKEVRDYLVKTHGFKADDISHKKVWAFGPDSNDGTNWLVDGTSGVAYLAEVRDSLVDGFKWACSMGPLAGEQLRGVICKLMDVSLHADSIHRGKGQMLPCARGIIKGAMYYSDPTFMEPVYLVDITVPSGQAGAVYSILSKRGGHVLTDEPKAGGALSNIRAFLPVDQSFGFATELKAATEGKASVTMAFDHWETMSSGFLTADLKPASEGKAALLLKELRVKRGMKPELEAM